MNSGFLPGATSKSYFVRVLSDQASKTQIFWNQQSPYKQYQQSYSPDSSQTYCEKISLQLAPKSLKNDIFVLKQGFLKHISHQQNQIRRNEHHTHRRRQTMPQKIEIALCATFKQRHLSCKQVIDQQTKKINSIFPKTDRNLVAKIQQAERNGRRVVGVIRVFRYGLSYRLAHCFIQVCQKGVSCQKNHLDINGQLHSQIDQLKNIRRYCYLYHLNGQIIHHICKEIQDRQLVLLMDLSPKLQKIQSKTKMMVLDLAHQMEIALIARQPSLNNLQGSTESRTMSRQIQVNPEKEKEANEFAELTKWYQQKYVQSSQSKSNEKNPLFESLSHYADEASNSKMLLAASCKIDQLPQTHNRHKYKATPLSTMLQKVRRQSNLPELSETRNIKNSIIGVQHQPLLSKKDIIAQLDRKNGILSRQNIPYLIEKYGVNRYEVYNLYNLYKSFEKISAMRGNYSEVLKRGIDRVTFDQGLRNLDMNPGEQLIRNICSFGDYISWEQFIKLVSISLRKTPAEKLEAILQGINNSGDGYLSRTQIDIMIGSSLAKIFDSEEPQLRTFFTNMAMDVLDAQNTGKVSINLLKQRVLQKGSDNMSMLSFLILNS